MPTVSELLARAAADLAASGVAEPRREASSLLAFALGKDRTFLVAHPECVVGGDDERRFIDLVARRAAREPLQYLTGRQEFYGLDILVTPDVLIPRPETEMVVENALPLLSAGGSFCEVGVGSGCISIAILKHSRAARAVGLERSPAAIEVARRNALAHGVEGRLELRESDVFSALGDETFEVIVSNPPYIPADQMATLQQEVRGFEPRMALTDEADGLSVVRRIVDQTRRYLRPGGHLIMEIGFQQAEDAAAMFDLERDWQSLRIADDLQGIPRCVVARLK
ncbi:MAG: peptide chain release factor N(5)-glutamine methyltransferase [Pyrinomonadaceae bacterium]